MEMLEIKALMDLLDRLYDAIPEGDKQQCKLERKFTSDQYRAARYDIPLIMSDGERYQFVDYEMGKAASKQSTADLEELVFWVYYPIINAGASFYEIRHRVPGQNPRRIIFAKGLELFGYLGPGYAARYQVKIDESLAARPYTDEKIPLVKEEAADAAEETVSETAPEPAREVSAPPPAPEPPPDPPAAPDTAELEKKLQSIELLYNAFVERLKRGLLPADKVKDFEDIRHTREQLLAALAQKRGE